MKQKFYKRKKKKKRLQA